MIKQKIGLLALIATLASSTILADDKLVIAGYSNAGDDNYSYLGYIQSLNGNLQDDGFRIRLTMENMGYGYRTDDFARHIDADATGGKMMAGYQWSFSPVTTLALWAGAQYRDTDLSPRDPDNHEANISWDSTYLVELNHHCSDNVGVMFQASHSLRNDEYWSRLYPTYAFANGMHLGPDISLMKGENWNKDQYGITLSGIRFGSVDLYVGTGDEKNRDDEHSIYGRIGGSVSF